MITIMQNFIVEQFKAVWTVLESRTFLWVLVVFLFTMCCHRFCKDMTDFLILISLYGSAILYGVELEQHSYE